MYLCGNWNFFFAITMDVIPFFFAHFAIPLHPWLCAYLQFLCYCAPFLCYKYHVGSWINDSFKSDMFFMLAINQHNHLNCVGLIRTCNSFAFALSFCISHCTCVYVNLNSPLLIVIINAWCKCLVDVKKYKRCNDCEMHKSYMKCI